MFGKMRTLGKFWKTNFELLAETLKKCWKLWENVCEVLKWLRKSILNIFMKSHENFKKNVGNIME